MAIKEIITANCENGQLSKSKIARQWDDQGTLIQFAGYPEPDTDDQLIFRLIVWMRASEDAEPDELPSIELEADQWLISNYYTQLPQMLRFQLCITNEAGTYEKHSPIFSGIVDKSLSHDGEEAEIDVIPLFDPYKKYVDELVVDAGARVVDTELDETSTNLVQNKAVATAVTALNGRLDQLSNSIGGEKPSAVALVSGGFSNSTGADYADVSKVRFANLIHLGAGDKMVADSSLQWYWACYSDESGTTLVNIRSAGFTGGDYTVVTDGWYKFVYRLKNDTSADLRERTAEIEALISLVYAEPQTGLFKDVADLQGDIENLAFEQTELGSQFDHIAKKVISDKVTTVTMHRDQFISGILNPDGSVQSSSAVFHTTITVKSGDVVTVKTFYLGSDGTAKGITDKKIGAVCAYSGGNPVPSSGKFYNANADNYIVPDGIDSIGVSFTFSGSNNRCYIYRTVPNGNIDYYEVQTTFKNPLLFSGNLSAGVFQPIGSLVCVDAYILTATCHIGDDFQSLKIGGSNAGQTGLIRPYIEVTPTQVKMYSNTSSSFDKTENHGLTLSDDLQIIVIVSKESLTANVIVQSKGARWASGDDWRLGTAYYGFGIISDTAISVVSASVSARDLYKPVWVCGDSWVTLYDARWYGQAVSLGIADFLHSGHSGEGSEEGLKHLKTLLSMYTPKMIVWLYGMNDMDTDSSTPNSAWLTALNEVKTICSDRTIALVLATIPTTPTRNNNAKNAVVTASGYRYVDEVSAMGADTAGNWISGYQSDDGNHTTEAGAKALLAQVLTDVPEIGLLN